MRQEQWSLEPDERSPRVARTLVSRTIRECGFGDDHHDRAVLLTSELVTNAVVHARTQIVLAVMANAVFRVIVKDDNARLPQGAMVPPEATSGRGLSLVQVLSDNWGVDSDEGGKRVWFEINR